MYIEEYCEGTYEFQSTIFSLLVEILHKPFHFVKLFLTKKSYYLVFVGNNLTLIVMYVYNTP